jgi:hypothetical protein
MHAELSIICVASPVHYVRSLRPHPYRIARLLVHVHELFILGVDLLSVVGGVDITDKGSGKKGGSSFADSAISTSKRSIVTGATFTGMTQFSEVR